MAGLASTLLLYAATFQFPDGIQVSVGALRGLKDTRVPMFIAMFAYWGLGMPLGAGLGLGLGMGPQGVDRPDRRPDCRCHPDGLAPAPQQPAHRPVDVVLIVPPACPPMAGDP